MKSNILTEHYLNNVKRSIDRFVEKTGVLDNKFQRANRGMLVSEVFAFCVMCEMFDIDFILESGVYNGQSSLLMYKYFKGRKIMLYSMDLSLRKDFIDTRSELGECEEWLIQTGNSVELFHKVLDELDANKLMRVAVLIDGPKGSPACKLALKCLEDYDCVKFAALHDVYANACEYRKNWFQDRLDNYLEYFTDDNDFVFMCSFLDGTDDDWKKCFDENGNGFLPYQRWLKGKFDERIKSYGPTLGFIVKENKFV